MAVALGALTLASVATDRAAAANCVLSECQVTVPAGTGAVTFEVVGGQGAPSGTRTDLALGGRGAKVTATIAANPGDRFAYREGAAGDNQTLGAGGGRASMVWRIEADDSRTAVIIAGGGGAAGHTSPRGRGGAGGDGGQSGMPGGAGERDPDVTCGTGGQGGLGASPTLAGDGGAGGTAVGCSPPQPTNIGNAGGQGSTGQGGDAGSGSQVENNSGGRGGNGVFGGGGGGGGIGINGGLTYGGGGGGGSSMGPAGASFVTGAGVGDGSITITFVPATTSSSSSTTSSSTTSSSTTSSSTTTTPSTTSSSTTTTPSTTTTLPPVPSPAQAIACSTLLAYRANLVALLNNAPPAARVLVQVQIDQVDRQLAASGCQAPPATTTTTTSTTTTTTTAPPVPSPAKAIACSTLLVYRANLVALLNNAPPAARVLVRAQIDQVDRQLAGFGCPVPT